MKGKLILIPTPIDEKAPLEPVALNLMLESCKRIPSKDLFLVEEKKASRARWVRFGLPREMIDHLILYNEQTKQKLNEEIMQGLKAGKNVFLMSDGGMPAFMDPGAELINLCHERSISVTSTPFSNSVVLAVTLSGLLKNRFVFCGFPPKKTEERLVFFSELALETSPQVVMDTPYRLKKILSEIASTEGLKDRKLFLAMDLNCESEELLRGSVNQIQKKLGERAKREFVLVLGPTDQQRPFSSRNRGNR
jgi:16S rRNA (cytidine1402-2'-O)-methyltransferase